MSNSPFSFNSPKPCILMNRLSLTSPETNLIYHITPSLLQSTFPQVSFLILPHNLNMVRRNISLKSIPSSICSPLHLCGILRYEFQGFSKAASGFPFITTLYLQSHHLGPSSVLPNWPLSAQCTDVLFPNKRVFKAQLQVLHGVQGIVASHVSFWNYFCLLSF